MQLGAADIELCHIDGGRGVEGFHFGAELLSLGIRYIFGKEGEGIRTR